MRHCEMPFFAESVSPRYRSSILSHSNEHRARGNAQILLTIRNIYIPSPSFQPRYRYGFSRVILVGEMVPHILSSRFFVTLNRLVLEFLTRERKSTSSLFPPPPLYVYSPYHTLSISVKAVKTQNLIRSESCDGNFRPLPPNTRERISLFFFFAIQREANGQTSNSL